MLALRQQRCEGAVVCRLTFRHISESRGRTACARLRLTGAPRGEEDTAAIELPRASWVRWDGRRFWRGGRVHWQCAARFATRSSRLSFCGLRVFDSLEALLIAWRRRSQVPCPPRLLSSPTGSHHCARPPFSPSSILYLSLSLPRVKRQSKRRYSNGKQRLGLCI